MSNIRRLLIVEDSDEDFEVTCWALEKAGYHGAVQRCERAEDALELLCPRTRSTAGTESGPEVLLLDLNLPGMNGRQLLQTLRTDPKALPIPVIILSTSVNPVDIADCYRFGAAGYMTKPMALDLYVEKCKGLLLYLSEIVTLADVRS